MTLDPASEARLQEVIPLLSDRIHTMAEMLFQEGITIRVDQGQRTWAQQDALYAQGRTAVGNVVTQAKGGESWHNFGCAVDCGITVDGTADWNADHPAWKRMEQVGISLGLTSGSQWHHPDNPHFQITGRFPENAPDDEARQIYQNEGAAAFWGQVAGAN